MDRINGEPIIRCTTVFVEYMVQMDVDATRQCTGVFVASLRGEEPIEVVRESFKAPLDDLSLTLLKVARSISSDLRTFASDIRDSTNILN